MNNIFKVTEWYFFRRIAMFAMFDISFGQFVIVIISKTLERWFFCKEIDLIDLVFTAVR